jgi:hypothetical protein
MIGKSKEEHFESAESNKDNEGIKEDLKDYSNIKRFNTLLWKLLLKRFILKLQGKWMNARREISKINKVFISS